MKFKFCSDGDCPLWALAGLHALGSLPAQLFRTLLQHVMEEQPDDGIMEILKDTSLSSREECARAAAVIRWVVQQALSCACAGSQLTRDLLVLGVPRAHAAALADAVDSQREAHDAHVRTNGFMVNRVTDVSVTAGPEGAVDSFKLSLLTADAFTGEQRRQELLLEQGQAKELLHQLKAAYQRVLELEVEQLDKEICEGAVDSYKLSLLTADAFTGEQRRQELLLEQGQAKELLHQLKAAYQRVLELEDEQLVYEICEGAVDSYKLSLLTADAFTGEQKRQELLLEQGQAKELLHQLKAAYQRVLELEV